MACKKSGVRISLAPVNKRIMAEETFQQPVSPKDRRDIFLANIVGSRGINYIEQAMAIRGTPKGTYLDGELPTLAVLLRGGRAVGTLDPVSISDILNYQSTSEAIVLRSQLGQHGFHWVINYVQGSQTSYHYVIMLNETYGPRTGYPILAIAFENNQDVYTQTTRYFTSLGGEDTFLAFVDAFNPVFGLPLRDQAVDRDPRTYYSYWIQNFTI